MRAALVLLAFLTLPADASWFRGNTHTHTNQSDGDSSPAAVAQWYADHGYQFLVITDHDKVTRLEQAPLLLIPGEEITDKLPKRPLHVNALGIETAIAPKAGTTAVETLQRDIDAVNEAGGIATVNHPNFGWALGSAELKQLDGVALLEIWSGHPYVNALGPPTVEQMWDDLLTAGKRIWGVATDDSHHFADPWGVHVALPGKGWIVVRAEKLEAKAILAAIRGGDFYASNGVEIAAYRVEGNTLHVEVKAKNGAHYRTLFIGDGGRVLHESLEVSSSFAMPASVRYVRVKVIDSNGRVAWLQPRFRN